MNEQVIRELLEQLKQNLKKIETAREQVEKTVNAYEVLKKDVRHYTEELNFIVQNTRTMISQLEEIKEIFLGNISANIIKEIEIGVNKITQETESLSSQVTSIDKLINTNSQTIIDDIKKRSDSIDLSLGTIQNSINSLSSKTDRANSELGEIKVALNTLTSNEDQHFKVIEKNFDAQEKFIYRELSSVRKQNIVLFSINAILQLVILGGVLHLAGLI